MNKLSLSILLLALTAHGQVPRIVNNFATTNSPSALSNIVAAIATNAVGPVAESAYTAQPASESLSNLTYLAQPSSSSLSNLSYLAQPASAALSNITFLPQPASGNLTNWSGVAVESKQDALGFSPQYGTASLSNWSALATASKQDALGYTAQPGALALSNLTYLAQPASVSLSNLTYLPQPTSASLSNLTYLAQPSAAALSNLTYLAQPSSSSLSNLTYLAQPSTSNLTNWSALATSAKQDALGYYPQNGSSSLSNLSSGDGTALTSFPLWVTNLSGLVNVKSPPYNATGDGVTDDTQAFKYALSNASVFVPPGTYIITNLNCSNSVSLQGSGVASVLKAKSGYTGYLLNNQSNTLQCFNLAFDGGYTGDNTAQSSATASRGGIRLSADGANLVFGCFVYNWAENGIYCESQSAINTHACKTAIIGNVVTNCWTGIHMNDAEYSRVALNNIRNCRRGTDAEGANISFVGNHYTDNYNALYQGNSRGANLYDGCFINHSTYAILFDGVNAGSVNIIQNCQIQGGGDIRLKNGTTQQRFVGCAINSAVFTNSTGTVNYFENCIFHAPVPTVTGPTPVRWNNKVDDGTLWGPGLTTAEAYIGDVSGATNGGTSLLSTAAKAQFQPASTTLTNVSNGDGTGLNGATVTNGVWPTITINTNSTGINSGAMNPFTGPNAGGVSTRIVGLGITNWQYTVSFTNGASPPANMIIFTNSGFASSSPLKVQLTWVNPSTASASDAQARPLSACAISTTGFIVRCGATALTGSTNYQVSVSVTSY